MTTPVNVWTIFLEFGETRKHFPLHFAPHSLEKDHVSQTLSACTVSVFGRLHSCCSSVASLLSSDKGRFFATVDSALLLSACSTSSVGLRNFTMTAVMLSQPVPSPRVFGARQKSKSCNEIYCIRIFSVSNYEQFEILCQD